MPRSRAAVILLLTAVSTLGCFSQMRKQPSTEPTKTAVAPVTPPAADCSQISSELAGRESKLAKLEATNNRQFREILESRARLDHLESQLQSQRVLLEEAIQEVVRARAKQRSVESRAEAASEIAEAEIALNRLDRERSDEVEVEQARQLLQRASEEFEIENFGGALYLATQVKGRTRRAAVRQDPIEAAGAIDGEQAFSVPVELSVAKRSNFREGPGTQFRVLRQMEVGAELTAYASKGEWLRVTSADGTSGWIHQSLVHGS